MNDFLKFLFVGAALTLAPITAIVIHGIITEKKLQKEMRKRAIPGCLIKSINSSSNIITIEDLDSKKEYEVRGEEISDELYENKMIFA